ncbi:MAG: polysaccharide biosynthesis C-terminal domain-containing protein [Bacteroidia bacterium]
MNPLRKLAGQTAVYGLSTIFGRLLNYALVPFYTYIFGKPADFGLNTEFYAYISFLNIIFTYGMETALFNFSSKEENKELVYSTALRSLLVSSLLLSLPIMLFASSIAESMRYPGHSDFVIWAIMIVATDAIAAIPFAKLREENKAGKFAGIKLVNIFVNLAFNFFFIGLCRHLHETDPESFLGSLYNPEIGIAYAFIANLAANIVTLVMLSPMLTRVKSGFDPALLRRMLRYALPLLVVGLAGMVNETMDRILLKYLLPPGIGETQVGIYGACYKISILMTIFIQAFRYAAEPFFFSQQNKENAPELYSKVMTYFVIFTSLIFLGTTMNLSWIQYFIGENYREGLGVVPVLLLANLFLGIYFNLSIWYKLTGRTTFGMWLTLFGAIITIVLNYIWIPSESKLFGGYMGSAWATLICYAAMMIVSYIIGQRYYFVNYNLKKILTYLLLTIGLYFLGSGIDSGNITQDVFMKNIIFVAMIAVVLSVEKPLSVLKSMRRGNKTKP